MYVTEPKLEKFSIKRYDVKGNGNGIAGMKLSPLKYNYR